MQVPITYEDYAAKILSGELTSCYNVYLAVKRYYEFKQRDDMWFDAERVEYLIKFTAKMIQFEGQFNGKPLILQPWQQFVIANIFGFKWKKNNYRVCTEAFVLTPRKSGKTTFMSAIAIIGAIADGENGAEIDFVANSREQAQLAFKHCSNFAMSLDPGQEFLKIYKKGQIKIEQVQSKIQVLSSDAMKLDGYNAHFCIYDEIHASKNYDLYNVMKESMGTRCQPLMLIISTAGFLLDGYPCYEMRKKNIDILEGNLQDDTQFSLIFELDKDDDWEDPKNWAKVQPSLNQTVSEDKMAGFVRNAKNNPSELNSILTKQFNMFCQSDESWLEPKIVRDSCTTVDMDRLKDEICYMGLDLSSTSDFTSSTIMFPPNEYRDYYPDKYIFKTFIYLPVSALDKGVNRFLYKDWKRDGWLMTTDSNVVQYDVILQHQAELANTFQVQNIYYDAYRASGWAIEATNMGLPIEEFPQTLGPFTKPTVQFGYLINLGKVIIDYNPVVIWCFNNAVLKYSGNGADDMCCKPVKAGGVKHKKIDCVITILESLGGYMSTPYYKPEILT